MEVTPWGAVQKPTFTGGLFGVSLRCFVGKACNNYYWLIVNHMDPEEKLMQLIERLVVATEKSSIVLGELVEEVRKLQYETLDGALQVHVVKAL